jgi:hypothetical protein
MRLEEQLRDSLHDPRHSLPGWPDAPQRITHGVRRRRRRRMAVAATGLALAALGSAGAMAYTGNSGGTAQTAAATDDVIAWIDAPATQLPQVARRSPRADARRCEPSDLGAKAWTSGNLQRPDSSASVLVSNSSDSRCTLSGPAKIVGTDAATGELVTLTSSSPDTQAPGAQYPATIDPGEPARATFARDTPCNADASPRRITKPAVVVGDRHLPLSSMPSIDACTMTVGQWHVLPPAINAPAQLVTIDAPREVRRGDELSYTVTLQNPSDETLELDPCPVYTHGLPGLQGGYHLNCQIDSVDPHSAVTFSMRYTVPTSAPVGATKLTWQAIMKDGKVATADLSTGGSDITVLP